MEELKAKIIKDLEGTKDIKSLNEIKTFYLGKKGLITDMYEKIKTIPNEEKKEYGIKINEIKELFSSYYNDKKDEFDRIEINDKLTNEMIDVTLPGTSIPTGSLHVLERVTQELEELFISMGYDVVEGPEVEQDLYNFEMLNLPKGHPARDAQDTFYIENDEILLRSQTSPVQVRTMLANIDKTPIRIVCPGKTYRRDYDDASHSHQFMQIEALLIDKDISLANLKNVLDEMAKKLFGENTITRFRPSFYGFTEPSVEYDVSCFKCHGKGCNVCKGTTWITIGGAGMVHPNVLKMSGYDNEIYTGFAFGFGIERIAMIKYGINDIRTFYVNDLRSSNTFDRKEEC